MAEDLRQAGVLNNEAIAVGRERIDAAVALLLRYDPDHHHPNDYVLTIAEAIEGRRYRRCDGRIWTDDGAQVDHGIA